jgi:hypothetical protein
MKCVSLSSGKVLKEESQQVSTNLNMRTQEIKIVRTLNAGCRSSLQ